MADTIALRMHRSWSDKELKMLVIAMRNGTRSTTGSETANGKFAVWFHYLGYWVKVDETGIEIGEPSA